MRSAPNTLYRVLFLSALLFCAAFAVGPLIDGGVHHSSPSFLMFQPLCHQDPERSFSWFGVHWSVCHRCASIYLGFLAMSALFALNAVRMAIRAPVFLILIAPMVLDAGANALGLSEATMISRIITGGLAGVALGWLVVPLLVDASMRLLDRGFISRRVHS